jgi:hypothetical protein
VKPEEFIHKKILFSALNWGMGHVARSISIIDQLLKQGNKVTIAASNQQRQIYTTYFPSIHFVLHEDYPFNFGAKGNFGFDLIKSSGSLFQRYREERKFVEKYVFENAIDLVLSDHRYGFYSNKVTSIFITHQIILPLSFFEKPIQLLHKKLLRNFNEIWVLDTEESEFAGKLSKKTRGIICTYIGIQSRFKLYSIPVKKTIDLVVIISGPSPYNSLYFKEMFDKYPKAFFIVPPEIEINSLQERFFHSSDWKKCDKVILAAKKICTRSGYSTLMDIYYLAIPYLISPTPGQAEQRYLCEIMAKKKPAK